MNKSIKNYYYKNLLFAFFLSLLIVSCVSNPEKPEESSFDYEPSHTSLFVLCEGLWGSDNASLGYIDLVNGANKANFYSYMNPGKRLGDLAMDMAVIDDTAYITVSTSSSVEAFRISTGKYVGRIVFPANYMPRKIAIVNDSSAFVTMLFQHCIMEFNPKTFELKPDFIATGPYPEGIAYCNNYLFVANSGYGDFHFDMPKAGTISVISIAERKEIANMVCGNNSIEVCSDKLNNKIYAAYYNLPSLKDSLGGIVEYDALSFKQTRQWRLRAAKLCLDNSSAALYFINGNTEHPGGVRVLNLNENNPEPKILIDNNTKDIWYSLLVANNSIWVGNAGQFQTDGIINSYSSKSPYQLLNTYKSGMNPNTFVFINK